VISGSWFPYVLTSIIGHGKINSSHLVSQLSTPKAPIDKSALISQATLWGNNAGFHDRRVQASEGDIRGVFSRQSERCSDSSSFVSIFQLPSSELRVEEIYSSDRDVVLCLSDSLDEKALKTLMRTMKLGTWFPKSMKLGETGGPR
jgi:hypothetical protein